MIIPLKLNRKKKYKTQFSTNSPIKTNLKKKKNFDKIKRKILKKQKNNIKHHFQ